MNIDLKEELMPVCRQLYCVTAAWEGDTCTLSLTNTSEQTICLSKIAVLKMYMPFAPDMPVYGEGYNMLSQYGGTVGKVEMIAAYGDFKHYKLPVPEGFEQVYNMARFSLGEKESLLMGFTSCRRFGGEIWFNKKQLQVILNLEGIEILPGETIALESFFTGTGFLPDLEERFAQAIRVNHPMLPTEEIPTGWCSWTVYGPSVTAQNIYDNLDAIKKSGLDLKYIQIDDGYQNYMGDWLIMKDSFGGGVEKLCLRIKEDGFEPAIWVAPFIAEENSELFQMHPDWFIKDDDGMPLPSDRVSFGGWRCGPWYMLDGTHPEARGYLTHVFRTMREKWKVKYFKMDANMWGAMPFGVHYEKNKTSIEAYRMGMAAILEGAGSDSFLLGCNAPMWPSIGTVHGMRITDDNGRRFQRFVRLKRECFERNWQNNRLWINDPDVVLLLNRDKIVPDPAGNPTVVNSGLTREEFLFNATAILASGGMLLSGDAITEFTGHHISELKKLLPPSGVAAVFESADYKIGRIRLEGEQIICVFNDDDNDCDYEIHIEKKAEVIDFWSDENLGVWQPGAQKVHLAGHSARALRMKEDESCYQSL